MGAWSYHQEQYNYPKQQDKWDNKPCLTCGEQLLDKGIWNNISSQERTCDTLYQYMILINDWISSITCLDDYPHNEDKIWRMINTKIEGAMSSKILEIKNNPPEPYCNKCDLIYNPPLHMIYTIPEEKKPISSCTSELELIFNLNSNFDNNDDKNNGSNSNSNPKTYITLPDLTKKQELKWFSDNDEDIISEQVHDTNVEFDLRYLEKDAIKLEPYIHTCIDLKITLEILATTIVQLAFRSSLAKKGINIKEEITDAEYVGNIIIMLQNDSEKAYIIEPNKKIAYVIFLFLVKIAQLV
ncbi:hypothetical protein G9A89_015513 [Geosiphon pyriformis]|nr:hypothetical protein G9A89_015513 [Geosiphon pyriformis]